MPELLSTLKEITMHSITKVCQCSLDDQQRIRHYKRVMQCLLLSTVLLSCVALPAAASSLNKQTHALANGRSVRSLAHLNNLRQWYMDEMDLNNTHLDKYSEASRDTENASAYEQNTPHAADDPNTPQAADYPNTWQAADDNDDTSSEADYGTNPSQDNTTVRPTKRPKQRKKGRQQNKSEKDKGRKTKSNYNKEETLNGTGITDASNNYSAEVSNASHASNLPSASDIGSTTNHTTTDMLYNTNTTATESTATATTVNNSSMFSETNATGTANSTLYPLETGEPTETSPIEHSDHTVLVLLLLFTFAAIGGTGVWWYRIRQRQLEQLRLQLLPVYNYDPADDQDDWENKLIGESTGLKSKEVVGNSSSSSSATTATAEAV